MKINKENRLIQVKIYKIYDIITSYNNSMMMGLKFEQNDLRENPIIYLHLRTVCISYLPSHNNN